MGLFDFFKKPSAPEQAVPLSPDGPYQEGSTNLIYHLLFCDKPDLYKASIQPPYSYPFNLLFSGTSTAADLQQIIDDPAADPRVKILGYNRQLATGYKPDKKELLAVIVEVGLNGGLDVLASVSNGTARYINQTGKILIWETTDARVNEITRELFLKSRQVIDQIGPWNKPRRSPPVTGNTRISFLVSDGLYFGEAPTDALFSDPLAAPALKHATQLMQYITERSLQSQK